MVCSKALRPGSTIPKSWTPPRYTFNDRVVVMDDYYGWSVGTIKGLSYVEEPDQYGQDCISEPGWHYAIAVDEGMPLMRFAPLVTIHQSSLVKHPAGKSEA